MTRATKQYLSDLDARADVASKTALPADSTPDSVLSELAKAPKPTPASPASNTDQASSLKDTLNQAFPSPMAGPAPDVAPLGEHSFAVRFAVNPAIVALLKALHIGPDTYGALLMDAVRMQGVSGPEQADFALAQSMADSFIVDLFSKARNLGLGGDSEDSDNV